MSTSIIRFIIVCSAAGLVGYFAGSAVGIALSGGPCATWSPGVAWSGAALGAGLGACAILMERPDPRACNREDPPMPPID